MTRARRSHLEVATYNIHSCVGADGRKDVGRVADVLDEMSCDVVGLQEVESHGPAGEDSHQLDYLARRSGYDCVEGPTIESEEGHYGNALLVRGGRCSIRDVRRHALGETRWEPRGVLEVSLEVDALPLRAIVTHLGLRPSERRDQVETILEIAEPDPSRLTVLLGDFNEWIPWAQSRRRLRERFGEVPRPPTFPSRLPLFALDRIWVQPRDALGDVAVHRTRLSRLASDHLPLRARVDWRGPVRRPEASGGAGGTG